MVGYLPNSISILSLLLILREGECILLHLGSVTKCFETVKGPALWKKKNVVNWSSIITTDNTSALKATAYPGANKQKAAALGRSTEVPEEGAPLSGNSPVLPVDSMIAPPMVARAIPVIPPENGAHNVYSLYGEKFGSKPKCVVRAPGRANIIGEHIDYMDFGVLPITLNVAVCMSAGFGTATTHANEGSITLTNACPDFPLTQVPADPSAPMVRGWAKYFQAGYKGVIDLAEKKGLLPVSILKKGISNLQVMVKGDVPIAGGLSSSAAMVVASALVISEAVELRLSRWDLCHLAIESERLVGVMSGGMDQTASVMGEQGAALYIGFKPTLSVKSISIPSGCAIVVADTAVKAEKSVSAAHHYNKRVVECRLASALLARDAGDSNWRSTLTLYQAALVYARGNVEVMSSPTFLRDVAKSAARVLSNDSGGTYSRIQLCEMLGGIDPIELLGGETDEFKCVFQGSDDFHLKDRARHVLQEAARVLDFARLCSSFNIEDRNDEILLKLGKLMDESHNSCTSLFDCSCKELNHLQAMAKNAGAIGSRLTGAGWRGCIVSLVKEENVDDFINAMKQQAKGFVIRALPSHGASICDMSCF